MINIFIDPKKEILHWKEYIAQILNDQGNEVMLRDLETVTEITNEKVL